MERCRRATWIGAAVGGTLVLPLWAGLAAGAAPDAVAVDYNRDVRPILAEHCFSCHGFDGATRQADLRLDTAEGAYRKSSAGRAVVTPGKPDGSDLLHRVTAKNAGVMPPPDSGRRLTEAEVDVLRRWIAQGAKYAAHWAYVPPRLPELPAVKQAGWVRNPIDRFILARLEKAGLKPSPEADRATLLRRVSLDLTGLPPTPAEVDAFLSDPAPDAYEKVVDRLLVSPQFGERWARPWLDLARYADSHGFQRDDLRDIWPYRDWVIRALNADMPFDQFTIEQLAGDLLPDATEAQKVATGFHRCTTTNVEAGSEPEETRVNQVIDRVNTTAAVWMGTTLECAQCHDHKYDPFTRKDYYRLFAYFNNTELEAERSDPKVPGSIRFLGPTMTLADPEREPARREARTELKRLDQLLDDRRRDLEPDLAAWEAGLESEMPGQAKPARKVPADIARILKVATAKRTPAQVKKLLDFRLGEDPTGARLLKERARAAKTLEGLEAPSTLVMKELPQPRPTTIFMRGDYRQPGEPVQPGTPALFRPVADSGTNRLALARWLVSPENPLVGRVAVNRWWTEIFGRGIVATVEDFGAKGEPPTHPELLDYLAFRFSTPATVTTPQGSRGQGAGGLVHEDGYGLVVRKGAPGKGAREIQSVRTVAASDPRGSNYAIRNTHYAGTSPLVPQPTHLSQGLGWSIKRLLRLIVTSAAYRQSSVLRPELQQKDPENRLVSRGPRHRMDAEMIRDSALRAAGLLSLKQFGPPIRPYQPDGLWKKVGGAPVEYVVSPGDERHRRGLYVVWKRATPYPSFVNFDATARLACTVKRSRSNTPLQALTLLNDPVYVEAGMALARRILTEKPSANVEERIRHGFRLCLARQPQEGEVRVLRRLFEAQLAAYREDGKPAWDLVADFPKVENVSAEELASWYAVATTLLNLDEMITKG